MTAAILKPLPPTSGSRVSVAELRALIDFAAHEALIRQRLQEALAQPWCMLRFFARYASWNGFFGSGVATLSGKVGRARRLFMDPQEPVAALADRSVFIASFIFDAARDEFDDHASKYRDTHRDLAQALISGLLHYLRERATLPEAINEYLADPDWLRGLNAMVASGYGAFQPDVRASLFRAIGYHLGSELLADREFSIIDEHLRAQAAEVVAFLEGHRELIGRQDHCAYTWITIHSGSGGAVEADHFAHATESANLALKFTPAAEQDAMRAYLHAGFQAFALDHHTFFSNVNGD